MAYLVKFDILETLLNLMSKMSKSQITIYTYNILTGFNSKCTLVYKYYVN